MLNSDINARFQDWLLSPSEGLDFEAKCWLDVADKESQGTLAKALIALENHGGGFLLVGYEEGEDKRLRPDPKRPGSLEAYGADAINDIVTRFAEPVFHVEVSVQTHPNSGEEFPLIRVTGRSRVPVRARRGTDKSIRHNAYYIRRQGPKSEEPQTGAEWDQLIRRCVLNQREEIVGVLRTFLPASGGWGGASPPPTELELLRKFSDESIATWAELNASLEEGHAAKIRHGYYAFSAHVTGGLKGLDAGELLASLDRAPKYTGWPAFVSLTQDKNRPRVLASGIQAWTAHCNYPGVSFADFWRITPDGNFFLLRGYDEDERSNRPNSPAPGTGFEPTLPVWRLGEFLLRMLAIASDMAEAGFDVTVCCRWVGLKSRTVYSSGGRYYFHRGESVEDSIETTGGFNQVTLLDLLPDVIRELTAPVYLLFDAMKLPDEFYRNQVDELKNGRR